MWLAVLIISIGVFTRLIPHAPNFSALSAAALFAGVYCTKKHGYLIPLAIYILSDLIIGLHNTVLFTWGAMLLIYALGVLLRSRKTALSIVAYTLFSSIVFFFITNFGVWLMGWYPHTGQGLLQCFINALPFFRTSLLADLMYSAAFFSSYEY